MKKLLMLILGAMTIGTMMGGSCGGTTNRGIASCQPLAGFSDVTFCAGVTAVGADYNAQVAYCQNLPNAQFVCSFTGAPGATQCANTGFLCSNQTSEQACNLSSLACVWQ